MTTITADSKELITFFENLQSKKDICDVVFKVGEEKECVYGIKAILAARSSVFASLFCSNLKQFETTKSKKTKGITTDKLKRTVISLQEFSYEEVTAFMDYIHTGICCIGTKILIGLFVAADDFKMSSLREKCLSILQNILSESNAIYFWKDLSRFKSKNSIIVVVEILSKFISINAAITLLGASIVILTQAELLAIFSLDGLNLSELSKFHAALIWTKAHMQNKCVSETLHSVFTPFLDFIKLTRIPIQILVEDVRRSKVVSERLLAHACAHNEIKDSFRSTTSLRDDNCAMPSKNSDAATKHHQPLVVGIAANARRSSLASSIDRDSQTFERGSKKTKKQSKNRYDLSQVSYYNSSSSSSSRLTKARKISVSTPCLDLMF